MNAAAELTESPVTPAQLARHRFLRNKPAFVSALFLLLMIAAMILAPAFSPYRPDTVSDAQFEPPSAAHWLGTDVHGRDMATRIFYGARISLLVGLTGAIVSLVMGVAWGSISGFFGGKVDGLMMRTVDILYSLPSILFVVVLVTTLEDALKRLKWSAVTPEMLRVIFLFVGLGAISWLTMARIVRGQVLTLRRLPFVEAARVVGASPTRILFGHILPNITGIVIAYTALTIPSIILYESFLSFLGLGIQPPMASWGSLIAEGAGYLNPVRVYWWLVVFPGITLVLTLLALNFVADGLRDTLESRDI